MTTSHAYIGTSPPRREDMRLVTGQGQFADDVALHDPLYISFVRSQVAHGEITSVDAEGALEAPGVVAVHSAQDLGALGALSVNPVIDLETPQPFELLVAQHVRATGQPIAAVLAQSPAQALRAAEEVWADIDETPPPAEPPLIAQKSWTDGDCDAAFAAAAQIVEVEISHPRLAPSPMEPRAIAVSYDPQSDSVTIWQSTQTPHRTRGEMAQILGVDPSRIRVIARDVGGAFGMKGSVYPEEVFAVWAALHHKRDVKWTATRGEDFLSATHGRGLHSTGALALDEAGNFLGLRAQVTAPLGPWLPNSALISAWNGARVLPSGYRVGALDLSTRAVQVPKGPMGIYRGAGRPEANLLIERLIDKAARVMGRDPVELRVQNLIASDQMPAQTGTGNLLDSGDYAGAMQALCTSADYDALRATRDARRARGELVGLGVAFYVEPSGSGWESARVTLNADGTAHVTSGSAAQGHGRETAFAQIAAEALTLPLDAVTVTVGDTDVIASGVGALASRSTAIGGSAVLRACHEVTTRRDAGEALPITADLTYETEGQAWGYGAYLALISIDAETGVPSVEHVSGIDDAGRVLNPAMVEGQVLGGFAQGFGEAMLEAVHYDEDGQLLTGSFMDYAMPRAADLPTVSLRKLETPSPLNTLGAKGVGEAGTIGAPAVLLNAAIDALSPLGVDDLTMPLTAHRLWTAIETAKQGQPQ